MSARARSPSIRAARPASVRISGSGLAREPLVLRSRSPIASAGRRKSATSISARHSGAAAASLRPPSPSSDAPTPPPERRRRPTRRARPSRRAMPAQSARPAPRLPELGVRRQRVTATLVLAFAAAPARLVAARRPAPPAAPLALGRHKRGARAAIARLVAVLHAPHRQPIEVDRDDNERTVTVRAAGTQWRSIRAVRASNGSSRLRPSTHPGQRSRATRSSSSSSHAIVASCVALMPREPCVRASGTGACRDKRRRDPQPAARGRHVPQVAGRRLTASGARGWTLRDRRRPVTRVLTRRAPRLPGHGRRSPIPPHRRGRGRS